MAPDWKNLNFDALLCDLDGVIRQWDWSVAPRIEQELGLPDGVITSTAFADDLITPAITGLTSHDEWIDSVSARLIQEHGAQAVGAAHRWSNPVAGTVDPAMLDFVRNVRASGRPVVLVTNATSRLDTDLAALGITEEFDAIANSAVLGSAKPDCGIYLAAAAMANADPTRCMFVDDQQVNIDAARRMGMRAVLFTCADDLLVGTAET